MRTRTGTGMRRMTQTSWAKILASNSHHGFLCFRQDCRSDGIPSMILKLDSVTFLFPTVYDRHRYSFILTARHSIYYTAFIIFRLSGTVRSGAGSRRFSLMKLRPPQVSLTLSSQDEEDLSGYSHLSASPLYNELMGMMQDQTPLAPAIVNADSRKSSLDDLSLPSPPLCVLNECLRFLLQSGCHFSDVHHSTQLEVWKCAPLFRLRICHRTLTFSAPLPCSPWLQSVLA